jgi:hypothetical protein
MLNNLDLHTKNPNNSVEVSKLSSRRLFSAIKNQIIVVIKNLMNIKER